MSEVEIKIPRNRVGVLVGKNGNAKKEIEEKTNCKLYISSDGFVEIEGNAEDILIALNIVKAIGRGFKETDALKLLKEENILEIINIKDFVKTKNSMIRLRGRVIGKEGTARKKIEEMTDTDIVVYGKTIGIIGKERNVQMAIEAIRKLLMGAKHSKVYHKIEMERKRGLYDYS